MAESGIRIVDDLDEAERVMGSLRRALQGVVHPSGGFDAERAAVAALEDAADYCRPSCGFLENGTCSTGDLDVCGCPCQHDNPAAV